MARAHPIVESVVACPESPRQVASEFRQRLQAGMRLRPVGSLRDPDRLLSLYGPRTRLELFDTTFYLSRVRQNEYVRFFVAYVVDAAGRDAHPRLFYKDVSLVWRVASHLTLLSGDRWIGKGDTVTGVEGGQEVVSSNESTTDLPLELQTALEEGSRNQERIPTDLQALERILRRAPDGRIEAYRDFTAPRRAAQADPRKRIHGNRRVAWFARKNDPRSLRFAAGFEPDLAAGIVDESCYSSSLYGGAVRRFRILSLNRQIQYLFMAGPRHVWIIPPQATSHELSSFGVRTVDVHIDEDVCLPGYEYHFIDDEGELYTQIPEGFAGGPSPSDETRADASRWLDAMPIVRDFRRRVLKRPQPSKRAGSPRP